MTMTVLPGSIASTAAAEAGGVTKMYGAGAHAVRALDGVSVAFARGTFTAVMGPSGSGKSTLMHAVAGLDVVDAGRVEVAGMDVTAMSEAHRTALRRDQIGFVFQSFNLIPALTAAENITLPVDLARRRVDPAWFDQLVETLALRDRLHHLPAQLSGGQQQRVAVARALIARPALVLADEPTGNLDSSAGADLLRFFRAAVQNLEQTIVMVTHDPVAASYAGRVVFLADGRLVDELLQPTVDGVIERMKMLSEQRKG